MPKWQARSDWATLLARPLGGDTNHVNTTSSIGLLRIDDDDDAKVVARRCYVGHFCTDGLLWKMKTASSNAA